MKPIIFFDDGGVLNSNQLRGEQWRPLIAEFMIEKFGGSHSHWMEANHKAMTKITEQLIEATNFNSRYLSFTDGYTLECTLWVETMFDGSGLELPPKSKYLDIMQEADTYVIPKINSAYPNIIETIKLLHLEGYELNTASGASERWLKLFLEPMGIVKCFKTVYGTDIINTRKVSIQYYNKIFEREKIDPKQTIIIDDSVKMLDRAKNLGANVIQSCLDGQIPEMEFFITDAKEIPNMIMKIEKNTENLN